MVEGERARVVGTRQAGTHPAAGLLGAPARARSLVVLIISWMGRVAAVAPPPRMCVFLHWAAAAAERAVIAWVLQTEVTD